MSRRPVRPHGRPPATVAEAFEDEVAGWLQVLRAARARDWSPVERAAAEGRLWPSCAGASSPMASWKRYR